MMVVRRRECNILISTLALTRQQILLITWKIQDMRFSVSCDVGKQPLFTAIYALVLPNRNRKVVVASPRGSEN